MKKSLNFAEPVIEKLILKIHEFCSRRPRKISRILDFLTPTFYMQIILKIDELWSQLT